MLDVALVEAGSCPGQRVQIGRGGQGMAVAAHALGPQFVGHKEDEVHWNLPILVSDGEIASVVGEALRCQAKNISHS